MKTGTLLRKLRDSKKLTTREIAQKTGVSLSTYIDWEHDKTAPSLRTYVKLASAFDISPVELMSYLTSQTVSQPVIEEKLEVPELLTALSTLSETIKLVLEGNDSIIRELIIIGTLLKRPQ